MSTPLNKVKNGLSGVTTRLTNFVNSLEVTESNVLLSVCLVILLLSILYLFITYALLNKKLDDLKLYTSTVTDLGKIYSNSEYDPVLFEKLLMDSLASLRINVNIITAPYFYSKNIDQILAIYPDYIKTMKFAKYVADHPDTRNDAIHKIMIKKYGPKYKTSPEIEIPITLNITGFYSSTYKHSLLIDIARSQTIYKKNVSRTNNILSKPQVLNESKPTIYSEKTSK